MNNISLHFCLLHQPIFTHDPTNRLFREDITFSIRNRFDSTISISFLVIVKNGRNNLAIVLVLFCKTQTPLLIIVAAFGYFKLFEQYRQWILKGGKKLKGYMAITYM